MNFIWQDFDKHDFNLEDNKEHKAETPKHQLISGKKYVIFSEEWLVS